MPPTCSLVLVILVLPRGKEIKFGYLWYEWQGFPESPGSGRYLGSPSGIKEQGYVILSQAGLQHCDGDLAMVWIKPRRNGQAAFITRHWMSGSLKEAPILSTRTYTYCSFQM